MGRQASIVLVMGVCGVGKTTIARGLAQRIGAIYIEADDYHPPENVRRMQSGVALTDEQRWSWLDAIAAAAMATTGDCVIACSALKRSYRDRLRRSSDAMPIIHLTADQPLLEQRMAARKDHFMPATLIRSQFEILELPDTDEDFCTISAMEAPEVILDQAQAFVIPRLKPDHPVAEPKANKFINGE